MEGTCGPSCGCHEPFIAQVGGYAPDFTASSYFKGEFKTVTLSEYLDAGKWVILFFYPLDFTFVCPTEIKKILREGKDFENEGAQILEFQSIPNTAIKHGQKGDLGDLEFPPVSDLKKEITESYGNPPPWWSCSSRNIYYWSWWSCSPCDH